MFHVEHTDFVYLFTEEVELVLKCSTWNLFLRVKHFFWLPTERQQPF